MDFSEPSRRPRTESIVPMINVVFLLLIFFLMTSQIAPPEPFEVSPPSADSETDPSADAVFFVDKSGRMSFQQAEGEAAIMKAASFDEDAKIIQVRADSELEAKKLATILRDLSQAGLPRIELVVSQR